MVLIHHTEFITPISFSILKGGFVGVDIFFVLSGFLITSILVEEFETTGTLSFQRFYSRRVLRLLPAVAAVLLFSAVVGSVIGFGRLGLTGWRVLSIVGYFANWVRAYESPDLWFLTHFWSLAIEEQFYLLWPFTLIGLLRAGMTRRGVIIAVFAAILILSLVISGKNRLSTIFSHPVLLWFGKRSYGLYIWHWPIFYLCGGLQRPALGIPGGLIGALVAATVSYRFIELPFLRMKENTKKHKDHAKASADLCAFVPEKV